VFKPVPASEQTPAFPPTPSFKQIPASEKVPVEALDKTNKMESMLSSELRSWSLPEDEQNFWQIFVPSGLFIILFLLAKLQFLRRCWHREDERKQKQTELQMILQGGEISCDSYDGTYVRGAR
jgi:hypothetical protein